MSISDVYWNYKVIEQVNGHWKFDVCDHAFTFPGILASYRVDVLASKTPETLPLVEIELYPRRSCFQHENRPESTPIPAKVGIVHRLTGWFASLNTPSPTPDAS